MREKGLFYKQVKEAEGRGSLEGHEGLGWLGLGSGMVAVPRKWSWNRAGPAPMWSMAEMTSHHRPHHNQNPARSAILLTAEDEGSARF